MNSSLVCLLPGESCPRLFSAGNFSVVPWSGEADRPMPVVGESTSFDEYVGMVDELKDRFSDSYVKAVLCRTICGRFSGAVYERALHEGSLPRMVGEAVMHHDDASLGFLFGDDKSGYWTGMTPELLLRQEGDRLATQALAGTRLAGTAGGWSDKDLTEHRYVVDDIIARLADFDTAAGTGTLRHGIVEHLCTHIDIAASPTHFDDIAARLHPTPAIGGLPRDNALRDIEALEKAPRYFYGGLLSLSKLNLAYVILRCVHFDNEHWCIYTGSGITAASDPLREWEETEAKAAPLVKIMNSFS